ncbi:MAG: hypothetical protein IPI60_13735 [Saprospiraceae bacterium]|nr:hypothetical protein [Saprospiraceae bacterium]
MTPFKKLLTVKDVSGHYFVINGGDLLFLSTNNQLIRSGAINWCLTIDGFLYPKFCDEFKIYVQYRNESSFNEKTKCLETLTGKEMKFDLPDQFQFVAKNNSPFLFRSKDVERVKYLHYTNDGCEIWKQNIDVYINKVKAVQFDLKDTFSQSNIEARRGAVKLDKWLVFADDLNNKVAAFNLETHELDWIWDLPQDDISHNERARCPLEIKGNDNKLYVKDNKNTLHIFEMN